MLNPTVNVLFLSHGGGPLPLLGDDGHREMIENLKHIASKIERPKRILLISAHWEESVPTVTGQPSPSLIYDYYGFPKEAYKIEYPAVGNPELAEDVLNVLERADIPANMDENRGFDHGMFVPLKIMYPDASIPCVQLSLKKGLNAAEHIEIGSALTGLKTENLLIIGSGFSFHNLKTFFSSSKGQPDQENEAFEQWLAEACTNRSISEATRREKLIQWEAAPGSRYCHPREEHLIPLHVCYGASQAACSESFSLRIMNKRSSVFLWQYS